MKLRVSSLFFCMGLRAALCQIPACDFREYHPAEGLRAAIANGQLEVSWQGERGQPLRARFAVRDGQPVIRELAVRDVVLGRDLVPEFAVVSGRRRISEQQLEPLRALKVALTPELLEREKWNAFWDAPLEVPGSPKTNPDLPRSASEIRRARASYHAAACAVKIEGARIEVTFDGLSMGIFTGQLRFTVYRGANLLRQEAIAKTEEPGVAYKYDAALKGFSVSQWKHIIWQDVARDWQAYQFGGAPNNDGVALRARNRLAIVETDGGSVAVFPPPHKFFFAREIELNLGYVWYRKDDEKSFSIGVRQAEREEGYRPYGISDAVWNRQVSRARGNRGNFALYNAPPGTWQHMPVYYYLAAEDARSAQQAVLAYTHDDRFKPLPGYQVATSHYHVHFNEELQDAGTMDLEAPWAPVFRGLGINIVILADFHGDGHNTGPARLTDQKAYFEGSRRLSDRAFLVVPGEEASYSTTGHLMTAMPRPVFWVRSRTAGQPLVEQDTEHGRVYHVGTETDLYQMLKDEGGFLWQSHPRTKGSTGFPDAVRETVEFRGDRFLGASFESLPVDQSEKRLCEARCFGTLDDMSNWAGPKYLIAEGDTYTKYPEDETYPYMAVNYIRLDRLPRFDDGWAPVLNAMRAGDFFVTTGEVLFRSYGIEGTGPRRAFTAEVEWTFPLEFVELVWGDGDKVERQVVSATETAPFGSRTFRLPFDAAGKKWVRLAVWDSAGNGAFTQPVRLN